MKRLLIFFTLTLSIFISYADEYTESYNVLSDEIEESVRNVQVIRNINGGTVILPTFDESCPQQMIAPFTYACKIVEEYLPPCLPLQVHVSVKRVNSSTGAVSKVLANGRENFGESSYYNYAQRSVIKGVIMGEMDYNSTITYLNYVDSVGFFYNKPDIEITYSKQKLDEICFSLDTIPGDKYDFVSVAMRDIIIGLGLSSGFRLNPITGELENPERIFTPFECYLDKILGNYNNPAERLSMATSGELSLSDFKLYAPTQWENGISLNYFIPQENCCISNILSYNFCKGMVTRSLSDGYANLIFHDLLGWRYNYQTSATTPSSTVAGSTSLYIPYNGSISFANTNYGINKIVDNVSSPKAKALGNANDDDSNNIVEYLQSYHPYFGRINNSYYGTKISIMKKDGTWDCVFSIPANVPDMVYDMSNWTFHYEADDYARTIDGYLRARIVGCSGDQGTRLNYKTTYFVVGYLPQKVDLSYEYTTPTAASLSSAGTDAVAVNTIRLYFSNTEGIDRIIVERLRQGSRVPSKFEIPDIKQGYYDVALDKQTTFTAVAYNENGSSRSIPITVTPIEELSTVNFELSDNSITIESEDNDKTEYNYTISSLSIQNPQAIVDGRTSNRRVDISTLSEGIYVLLITDTDSGSTKAFKFRK